ncbi:hypothetical protein HNQ80_001718 [Anaerosolibacter carboniphilus]|uniref:Uncharacterized protein n=1 Tax=Anaerosolibacter carboniphilus TaxID=1417629 RepID=A0A841KZR0_9FIRM|nr:hypothetical protein [Anaerosolibacter carboniphilus]MBB6215629.1 hypothetical protein [Anaerosolibacter carboniphilus]
MEDFLEALEQFSQAQQNFSYADPNHIDIATFQLKAAELKIDAVLKRMKRFEKCKQCQGLDWKEYGCLSCPLDQELREMNQNENDHQAAATAQ